MNRDDFVDAMADLAKVHANIKRMGDAWRDEETGLPIHTHAYENGCFVKTIKPKPCDCGQSIFDISKSVGELVERHEKEKERMTPDPKEQLWPIDDILASLETECMIGVKLEKDGKISSEERRKRVEAAHSVAFSKLALLLDQLRHI